jgi:hypothetical protein
MQSVSSSPTTIHHKPKFLKVDQKNIPRNGPLNLIRLICNFNSVFENGLVCLAKKFQFSKKYFNAFSCTTDGRWMASLRKVDKAHSIESDNAI